MTLRALARLLTLVMFAVVCRPCFYLGDAFLWIMIVDNTIYSVAWVFWGLYYATGLVAVWMFVCIKADMWNG